MTVVVLPFLIRFTYKEHMIDKRMIQIGQIKVDFNITNKNTDYKS